EFVCDEVAECQHVDVANRRLPVEGFAGAAVIELRASVDRQSCLLELLIDVIHGSAIEDRRRERSAELLPCPAKKRLEDLPQVHSGRHTQDRKSTRLNSSHVKISYAVFCLKK